MLGLPCWLPCATKLLFLQNMPLFLAGMAVSTSGRAALRAGSGPLSGPVMAMQLSLHGLPVLSSPCGFTYCGLARGPYRQEGFASRTSHEPLDALALGRAARHHDEEQPRRRWSIGLTVSRWSSRRANETARHRHRRGKAKTHETRTHGRVNSIAHVYSVLCNNVLLMNAESVAHLGERRRGSSRAAAWRAGRRQKIPQPAST